MLVWAGVLTEANPLALLFEERIEIDTSVNEAGFDVFCQVARVGHSVEDVGLDVPALDQPFLQVSRAMSR